MENRLKERLTGAAILVALIVLLVPEMFRGQPGGETAPASSGDGPPIRSYTIDLSNNASTTAPLQATPPAPVTPEGAAESAPSTSTANAAQPATAAASAQPSLAANAPTLAAGAVSHGAAATASKSPAANAAVASAATPHGAGAGWSVQLGLFAQHDNGERLAHAAQAKGFAASLSDKDAKGFYHVQVGNLSDRPAAVAMQERLREQGFQAAVVAPH